MTHQKRDSVLGLVRGAVGGTGAARGTIQRMPLRLFIPLVIALLLISGGVQAQGEPQPSSHVAHASASDAKQLLDALERNPEQEASPAPELKPVLAKELLNRVTAAIATRDERRIETLLRISSSVVAAGSEEYRILFRLQELLSVIDSRIQAGELTKFRAIQDTLQTPTERDFYELFLRKRLLASATRHQERPVLALRQLAAVPEKGRNDEVAAFALSLVEKIHNAAVRERSEEVIADWERDWIWFKRFYTSFTGEKVQAQLAGINELLALRAVQSGRIDAANDFFGEMLRWRPDPSEENNELRRQVIRAAESDDARAFAHGRVAELDRIGAIDLPLKMRVFFQGYYGKGAVYVVFWIFTGVILFFFAAYFLSIAYGKVQKWLGRRPAKVTVRPKNEKKPLTNLTLKEQSGQPAPQVDEGEKEDDAAPVNPLRREELGMFQQLLKGNKKGPGYMNVKEEPDEYGRLLDKFGLDDGVSEDDIKTAFRKVAKELHPDRVGPEGEEQFREFQIAYERLIEIRKSWFGR